MRERPIIFSAPMVRAILAGTKTQTRRVVKPQGPMQPECWDNCIVQHGPGHSGVGWYAWDDGCEDDGAHRMRCPYGQSGDRLWVRETWKVDMNHRHYRADEDVPGDLGSSIRWIPSIHMPRWASRITLEVTGVRVEHLQDISAEDAKAEGISEFIGGWWCEHEDAAQIAGMTPQEGYRHLWERINGPGSWDANPWVWVVEFRRAA